MNPSENNDINDKLNAMEDRLSKLEENITSIDRKLTQVVDAILGNPLTKAGGFVNDIQVLKDKVKSLEEQIEAYKDFRKKMTWTTGIIVGITVVIYYAVSLYLNIR
jgi:chromosome segregation ATPase